MNPTKLTSENQFSSSENTDQEKSSLRLHWGYKLLIVVGPAAFAKLSGIIVSHIPQLYFINLVPLLVMIAGHIAGYQLLKGNGYLKMAKQLNIWFIVMWCLYVGLAVMITIITALLVQRQ